MGHNPFSTSDQQRRKSVEDDVECLERPPSSTDDGQPSKTPGPLSLHIVALLIPASIFGALARIGLLALTNYDGHSIFPLAYVQGVGCLFMGFFFQLKEPLGHFYPPLYTALTTGFCGSLTTFSGWQLDVFNSWINAENFHRGGLRDFIDGVGKSVFTVSISLASISFGMRLASLTSPHLPALPSPSWKIRHSVTILSILSYAAVFPAYFLLPARFRHQATAALLFAYPGALTRYILSIQLNHILKAVPLGTFTANAFGTALLGAFYTLQHTVHPASPGMCAILQGLSDGYCGSLTTISTFAVEIRGLKGLKGFWYGLLSWTVGQLLLLVIFGSSLWSGHARDQITCRLV